MKAAQAFAVIPSSRAGDFILTTGLFNAIKQYAPGSELTVVVGRRAAAMARHHPAIDRVLVFDRHPLRLVPFLIGLRGRTYDAWLDPKDHFSRNQTLLARFAKAEVKVGFNRPGGGPFDLQVLPPADPSKHFAEKMMAPLDLIGMPWDYPPRLSLGLPPESVARAATLLVDRAPLEVLVNVSAGMAIRYWPEARWVELLPRLARLRPTRFWLSSAPEDDTLADRIVAAAGRGGATVQRLPKGSLLDVAAMVARMDAVVTMDTSIVHLASVFERPIVALFTNYEANFIAFRPLSPIQALARGESIAAIPVSDVAAAYERLLARL